MRTITEFFGMSLKSALEKIPALNEEATKSAEEAMKAEGKTEEEIKAGLSTAAKSALNLKISETFKLEGEKLAMFTSALDVFKGARGTVKRIIVMAKMKEDEVAPSGLKEIDGKFYMVENFPEPARAAPREERGGKFGDKRGGGKGGRGKGDRGKGGERGNGAGSSDRGERRPNLAPRPDAPKIGGPRPDAGAPGFTSVVGSPRPPKAPRPPRAPRAPRPPVEPYKGPNRIALKGSTPTAAPEATSESNASDSNSSTT